MCGCCSAGWTSNRASAEVPNGSRRAALAALLTMRDRVLILRSAHSRASRRVRRRNGRKILRRVGVRVVAGGRGFRSARTARQRKVLALIQGADAALVEAGFVNLKVGAVQRIRRQFLNGELHRGGRGVETAIRETRPLLLADGCGKQFGGGVVAEGSHRQ